ncbi:MAG TPA: hypothetical protein VHO46_01085 [Bacteroidales bacterium]|nr:hypothetical protein [Bacteroidales bacterium]
MNNRICPEKMSNPGSESNSRKSIIPHGNDSFSNVNEILRNEIEEIIGFVADKRSIPALINLLDDQDVDIRWIAAESLIRIGRISIIPLLNKLKGGKKFSYPGKANYVLQCLLTKAEKKSLQPLLSDLTGNFEKISLHEFETSVMKLKSNFGYIN